MYKATLANVEDFDRKDDCKRKKKYFVKRLFCEKNNDFFLL